MRLTREEAKVWIEVVYVAALRSKTNDEFEFFHFWMDSLFSFVNWRTYRKIRGGVVRYH